MKDLNQHKVTGINSLGLKFSLLVFLAVLCCGLVITYAFTSYHQSLILQQQQQAINRTAENYQKQLDRYLNELEQKAVRAQQILVRTLSESNAKLYSVQSPIITGTSIRSIDEWSGLYSPGFENSGNLRRSVAATALAWQQMMPLLQQDFSSVLFLALDNYVRVAPAEWALHVNPDFAIRDNMLFQRVTPEANPERKIRWSEPYYDDIWQSWQVSILIPVYQQDIFLGVMAFSLKLHDLLANRSNIGYWSSFNRSIMLDSQGRVLDAYRLDREARMLSLYRGPVPADPELALVAQGLPNRLSAAELMDLAPSYLTSVTAIPKLDWYLVLFQERDKLLSMSGAYKFKSLSLTIAIAFLLTLLLYLLMHQILLKRLKRLSLAVERLGHGELHSYFLDFKPDELGMLNRAFVRMSNEINQLVDGLQLKINEKEQAELLARKLSKAVSFSSSGIAITNKHLEVEYVNPYLEMMLEQPKQNWQGTLLFDFFIADMQTLSDEILKALEMRQHWHGDLLLKVIPQEESTKWVSLAIAPIRDEKAEVTHYVATLQDISFIKQSQKKMEQLAYYDALTGLANRSYFRDQLRKAISMSQRGYYSFALLYFDLDEFKLINDTLGHDAGDELLIEIARRLKSRLRDDDLIARLGGDEFAVILSDIKDKVQAGSIASKLQQAFLNPVRLGAQDVSISASIGITVAPDDAVDEELLLKHADLAMYEAKARGKNTYRFFSPQLNEAANERLLIESQLREGIREQQFLLYYQPKIDLVADMLVGYEALIRWLRPDNTLVPPNRFIHIAESTGLIVQIGEWIILEACRFLARQHSRGYAVSVSINLSARQFHDEQLTQTIEQIIRRTGVDPAYLVFEITESMLMGDIDAAIKQLNQLKRLGVSLSIDDFGTGYSSLNYLKRFPVDELKIDRSFVKDIPDDQNDMDIVAAIIAMAQKMQLRVVAEGVESEAQAEFLKQNACYQVQGYYYSMPLAEQELSHLTFTINTQG